MVWLLRPPGSRGSWAGPRQEVPPHPPTCGLKSQRLTVLPCPREENKDHVDSAHTELAAVPTLRGVRRHSLASSRLKMPPFACGPGFLDFSVNRPVFLHTFSWIWVTGDRGVCHLCGLWRVTSSCWECWFSRAVFLVYRSSFLAFYFPQFFKQSIGTEFPTLVCLPQEPCDSDAALAMGLPWVVLGLRATGAAVDSLCQG